MIDFILFSTGIAGLIAGSVMDLRTHEVADWLNYGLIFSGLGLRLIDSLASGNYSSLLFGIYGFTAFLAIGLIMFYTGQWGGGDSKMIMGLGALFGSYPAFLYGYLNPSFGNLPFLLAFIINIIIFGGIYGLLWSFYLIIRHFKRFQEEFRERIVEYKKNRRILLICVFGLLLASIGLYFHNKMLGIYLLAITSLIFFTFYLYVSIKAIEKACMCRYIVPEKLTEGDWIVNEVMLDNIDRLNFRQYVLKSNPPKPRLLRRIRYVFKVNGFLSLLDLLMDFEFLDRRLKAQMTRDMERQTINWYKREINRNLFRGRENPSFIEKIINGKKRNRKVQEFLKSQYGYTLKKIRVTGPSDLGIESHQIEALQKAAKKGLVKRVKVKEGIPFVPSFLFAFIATIIWGNLIFLFT